MRAGEIRDGSEAVFVGAHRAACCVAFACDDGRDPSGLTLSGFGPIWHAATMLAALLLECGLALAGLGQSGSPRRL